MPKGIEPRVRTRENRPKAAEKTLRKTPSLDYLTRCGANVPRSYPGGFLSFAATRR